MKKDVYENRAVFILCGKAEKDAYVMWEGWERDVCMEWIVFVWKIHIKYYILVGRAV